MKTIPISELGERIEVLITAGREEPVEIMRDGERLGVFISDADAALIEDLLLAQKAALARSEGFVGTEASKLFLDRFRNVAD